MTAWRWILAGELRILQMDVRTYFAAYTVDLFQYQIGEEIVAATRSRVPGTRIPRVDVRS
jgi:hypothetical protein